MSEQPVFSRKLVLAAIGAAIGAFVLSLYLMKQEGYGVDKSGQNSFSRSAVGYEGLARLLYELDITVIRSRRDAPRAARNGLLIVAEPNLNYLPRTTLPQLPDAERILLVLPKWTYQQGAQAGWIEMAFPIPLFVVQNTLRLASDDAKLERFKKKIRWKENKVGVEPPSFARDIQLIQAKSGIRPLVAAKEGILLGETEKDGKKVWVLSDPDMLSNQAFGKDGGKIAFAVALINLLSEGGPVVFDETVHGFSSPASHAAQMLFEFPYNMIALQILAGLALLLWGAMGRFGIPEKVPEPLMAGKEGLVGNVAHLMEFAGHEKLIIQRYIDNTIREAALHLHAPKDLSQSERIAWLQRIGKDRGVTRDPRDIMTRADRLIARWGAANISQLSAIAQEMQRWKQEIIDGSSEYSRRHGRRQGRGQEGDHRPG